MNGSRTGISGLILVQKMSHLLQLMVISCCLQTWLEVLSRQRKVCIFLVVLIGLDLLLVFLIMFEVDFGSLVVVSYEERSGWGSC